MANSTLVFDLYLSGTVDPDIAAELMIYPVTELLALVNREDLRAESTVDFSLGPNIFQLFPSLDISSAIILLDISNTSITERQRWLSFQNETLSLPFSSTPFLGLIGNNRTSGQVADEIRSDIKQLLKSDFDQANPTYPVVLKKTDYLQSFFILNFACPDLDSCRMYIKKMSSMINAGGNLVLCVLFGAKFYKVGLNNIPLLAFNESFMRQATTDAHLTIKYLKSIQSKDRSEFVRYEQVCFIHATKNTM